MESDNSKIKWDQRHWKNLFKLFSNPLWFFRFEKKSHVMNEKQALQGQHMKPPWQTLHTGREGSSNKGQDIGHKQPAVSQPCTQTPSEQSQDITSQYTILAQAASSYLGEVEQQHLSRLLEQHQHQRRFFPEQIRPEETVMTINTGELACEMLC